MDKDIIKPLTTWADKVETEKAQKAMASMTVFNAEEDEVKESGVSSPLT